MTYYELTDLFHVAADAERTWAFFSSAENLATITPPWLNFTVQTKIPIDMRQDTLLDYTIRWSGVPVKWRTIITDWRPPHFFSDMQIRGPYAQWYHQHFFEPAKPGGTDCRDRVIYALPFGPLGSIAHAMIVSKQLLEIFRFRRDVIGKHLGGITPTQIDVQIRKL